MDVTGASIDDYTGRAVFQRRGEIRGRDPPGFLSFFLYFVCVCNRSCALSTVSFLLFFFRIFLLPYGRGKGFHERKRKRGVKTMHIERRISALGGYKVAGAPVAMCGDATSVQ